MRTIGGDCPVEINCQNFRAEIPASFAASGIRKRDSIVGMMYLSIQRTTGKPTACTSWRGELFQFSGLD